MKFYSNSLAEKITNAPLLPGCYIFKNSSGKILYIGKAIILRDRVKSYFNPNTDLLDRIRMMVPQIRDVEFIAVDSEAESLVLETNLIHKYHPKYNSDKKDDKNYQWLKFIKKEDFQRPILVREKIDDNAQYFGPYPDSLPLKRTLKYLRKVFPYRTCNRKIIQYKNSVVDKKIKNADYSIRSSDTKPCLYYFLGLCPAPCASKIYKKEYLSNIKHIKEYFSSKKENLIYKLKEEMAQLAKDKKYEAAAVMRDKINDFIYVAQRIEVENNVSEKQFVYRRNLSKIMALNELLELIKDIGTQIHEDFKIECYDISNIQGKLAVGSMVVFINGIPARDKYRKFKIKLKDSPDDYAMMQEVFIRRFSKKNLEGKDKSFSKLPDLIIVDGGKGQLSASYKILTDLKINIPVIGLAKRYEDIFMIKNKDGNIGFTKKILAEGSESRFLMQRIRDEAHRFGIEYHRALRLKAQKFSIISTIPGVGKVIGLKLLRAFGSLDKIKTAKTAELYEVVKNKRTVKEIKDILK